MPSFDIVSNLDYHELTNAIDQTNREVSNRFDFKDTNARVEFTKPNIILIAPTDFQVKQLDDILRNKLTKRNIDLRSLTYGEVNSSLSEAKQNIEVKQGIETENAKKLTKLIKESGIKIQAAIQGDQVRVTGKKRDDLQAVMAMLREAKFPLSLQFENFRD